MHGSVHGQMAERSTIHPTKPSNSRFLLQVSPGALVLAAGILLWAYPTEVVGRPWLLALLAALVVAMAALTVVQYARETTLVRDGATLIHSAPLGRKRVLARDELTEVVGRSIRAWESAPALRLVVFRRDESDALRLLAMHWDLDALDRLAEEMRLPVRNETVRPRLLPRLRRLDHHPRIA